MRNFNYTLREKCPSTEFFLARIFPHSDWITERYSVSLCVFSPNGYGPDKTPYLDTFRAVMDEHNQDIFSQNQNTLSVLKKEQIGDMGF